MAKIVKTLATSSLIPWQNPPQNMTAPVWRYSNNPIIGRNPLPGVSRIFNSAVTPFGDGFAGVFRVETTSSLPHLRVGKSLNGINWTFAESPINFYDSENKIWNPYYAYDPRVIQIDKEYYIVWCTEFHGPSIGIAKTRDFIRFERLENAFLPFNRNGVLFPRKIKGKYKLLSRPSDGGHTPFGDIFISESDDCVYWGKHRHVMGKGGSGWWQNLKIGGGPAPIETDEGWLLFYHGVTNTCNGYVYSMGVALLDLEEPSIVIKRASDYCLTPEMPYEEVGFVPNVVFPCAAIAEAETGRIAIYYGAADSYVALAFTDIDTIFRFLQTHHEPIGDDQSLGK
ncbi:MAG: glycosylase [Candidatus Izemoplasmatales bacterium]|jgi:beta-1,4-mannooligosaccharide/beta-1,4-mannosyl-N-acetylglucosamine phosphorylase